MNKLSCSKTFHLKSPSQKIALLKAQTTQYNPSAKDAFIDKSKARFFTSAEAMPNGKVLGIHTKWDSAVAMAKKHNLKTGIRTGVLFEDREDLCLLFIRLRHPLIKKAS